MVESDRKVSSPGGDRGAAGGQWVGMGMVLAQRRPIAMITNDLYTYSIKILRQDKRIRDHSSRDDCHVTLAVRVADVTIEAVQSAERARGFGATDSGKHSCFRLESNQAPAFRRGGGTSVTGSREREPEPRIGLGLRKGGRFTAGGASIAHLWHGVITGYRSRAEGSTTPYAAFTP